MTIQSFKLLTLTPPVLYAYLEHARVIRRNVLLSQVFERLSKHHPLQRIVVMTAVMAAAVTDAALALDCALVVCSG